MRNLFGWDCFLDFYTDVLTYSCKQWGAIAEKHWGIVDGKLVDYSSVKILLNNVNTPGDSDVFVPSNYRSISHHFINYSPRKK